MTITGRFSAYAPAHALAGWPAVAQMGYAGRGRGALRHTAGDVAAAAGWQGGSAGQAAAAAAGEGGRLLV